MGMTALVPPAMDEAIRGLIRMAVREDLGEGDLTVRHSIPAGQRGVGTIVARRAGVVAGTFLLPTVLAEYEPGMGCEVLKADGEAVAAGEAIARVSGGTRAILSAERVVLNFLGHLSGIATLTRRYVDAVAGTKAVICDTRKTTPGFRALDKYAVRCGGGVNHRMGLYDGVMLKDNHLAALRERLGAGLTLAQLTAHLRRELDPKVTLWLEVDTLEQLREALAGGGADVILLDNFSIEQMREAVGWRQKGEGRREKGEAFPLLEASGGITLANVAAVAGTGVERISIGALTHSAPVLDVSMELG